MKPMKDPYAIAPPVKSAKPTEEPGEARRQQIQEGQTQAKPKKKAPAAASGSHPQPLVNLKPATPADFTSQFRSPKMKPATEAYTGAPNKPATPPPFRGPKMKPAKGGY